MSRASKRRKIDSIPSQTSISPLSLAECRRAIAHFLLACESVAAEGGASTRSEVAPVMSDFVNENEDAHDQIAELVRYFVNPDGEDRTLSDRTLIDRIGCFRVAPLRALYDLVFPEDRRKGQTRTSDSLSRDAILVAIDHAFQLGTVPLVRRNEERKILDEGVVDPTTVFVSLCGKAIPKEILGNVLSFHGFNRLMLDSVGLVSWDFFVAVLCCWDEPIQVTKFNLHLIPVVVLKSTKEIRLMKFPRYGKTFFSMGEMRYVWKTVVPELLCSISIPNPIAYQELHRFFRTMKELESEDCPVPFPSVRRLDFPKKITGLSTTFPGLSEFSLGSILPNLEIVNFAPLPIWLRHLSETLTAFSFGPSNVLVSYLDATDFAFLPQCQRIRHLSLPTLMVYPGRLHHVLRLPLELHSLDLRAPFARHLTANSPIPLPSLEELNLRIKVCDEPGFPSLSCPSLRELILVFDSSFPHAWNSHSLIQFLKRTPPRDTLRFRSLTNDPMSWAKSEFDKRTRLQLSDLLMSLPLTIFGCRRFPDCICFSSATGHVKMTSFRSSGAFAALKSALRLLCPRCSRLSVDAVLCKSQFGPYQAPVNERYEQFKEKLIANGFVLTICTFEKLREEREFGYTEHRFLLDCKRATCVL